MKYQRKFRSRPSPTLFNLYIKDVFINILWGEVLQDEGLRCVRLDIETMIVVDDTKVLQKKGKVVTVDKYSYLGGELT